MTFSHKKIAVFALACCLCLFFSHDARATSDTNISVWGDMDIAFDYINNYQLGSKRMAGQDNNMIARQRVRLWAKIETSDQLRAYLMFRIPTGSWGQQRANNRDVGYAVGTDGVNLATRFAFLDWNSKEGDWVAKMGLIPVNVPWASFYSGILDTSAGGVELGHIFNEYVALYGTWARLHDQYRNDDEGGLPSQHLDDETDMFMLKMPLTFKATGLGFTPWVMHTRIGKDSGYWESPYIAKGAMADNAKGWWGGLASKVEISDRLTLKHDVIYGSVKTNKNRGSYNSRGWQSSALLDYKANWGTPGVFGWYATGSDADKVRDEGMWGTVPIIDVFDFGFNPTSFGFNGGYGVSRDGLVSSHAGGRWGIGAEIKDISFVDKLTHEVRVAYYRGTNDKGIAKLQGLELSRSYLGGAENVLMTRQDDAIECNFNHTLKIYDNLAVKTSMGFISLDRGSAWKDEAGRENAWQFSTNFKINF